jgi:hypothetical protein
MPLVLSQKNLKGEIARYLADTANTTIPTLSTADPLALFRELKRTALSDGPYRGLTILEVANRTLSDLVVFAVAEHLLHQPIAGLQEPALEVKVLLGTEDGHDVMAVLPDQRELRGECFNVARSFFRSKLHKTRKKLRSVLTPCVKLIAFNEDACELPLRHRSDWVIHLPIAIDAFLERHRSA